MSDENEYDLKKSKGLVNELYPVLKDRKGRVIDGFHRLEADPSWRSEVLKEIDTEEKFLCARLIANLHRRVVPTDETEKWINQLGELYLNQGVPLGEITNRIAENTGYSKQRVRYYLDPKYKLKTAPTGQTLEPSVFNEITKVKTDAERQLATLKAEAYANRPLENLVGGVWKNIVDETPDKWHAVRFERGILFKRFASLVRFHNGGRLEDWLVPLNESVPCEYSVSTMALHKGWICPGEVEWVVLPPKLRQRPFPRSELMRRGGWFFWCEDCIEALFPNCVFHDDIMFKQSEILSEMPLIE